MHEHRINNSGKRAFSEVADRYAPLTVDSSPVNATITRRNGKDKTEL